MNDFTKGIWGFFHSLAEFSTEILNFVQSFKFCFRGMNRSKKIFLAVGAVFIIVILIVSYDIATKTSFPGSKKYLKEAIAPSIDADTTKTIEQTDSQKYN